MSGWLFPASSVVLTAVVAVYPGAAQTTESAEAAARLVQLLEERKLDAVAARDPERADRFLAALYIPGSQLLVIGSAHQQPEAIDYRIAERQYRDVYTDLHGSGVREGRVFVTDLGADGLQRTREPGQPFDIVYRNGVDQVSYDGDWKRAKLNESQYDASFGKDDAEYARMLTALAAALAGHASDPR